MSMFEVLNSFLANMLKLIINRGLISWMVLSAIYISLAFNVRDLC